MKGDRNILAAIVLGIVVLAIGALATLIVVGEIGYFQTYGCLFDFSLFDTCGSGQIPGIASFVFAEALLIGCAALVARASHRLFASTGASLFAAATGVLVVGFLWAFILSPHVFCEEGWRIVDEGSRFTSLERAHCRELGVAPHIYRYAPAHEDHTRRLAVAGGALATAMALYALAVWKRCFRGGR